MAAQRAATEPEKTTFDASVSTVDERSVQLDRTYFYAESGGQPADRGTIAGIPVTDVRITGDGIEHVLAEPATFAVGDVVEGAIDEQFRTYCRRAHTASHVLYGVARDVLADLGYGGFDIDEEKVRIDFETTTHVDDATLIDLERRANLAVWESRPVTWETMPLTEVRELPGVAFNTKTEEGVFGESDHIRIVEIGPAEIGVSDAWLDRAACGGTHVRNTRDIGPIAVLDRSNPGEGLTRIELGVGPTAIEDHAAIARAANDAAEAMGIGVEDVPDRVRSLQATQEELEEELRRARDSVIGAQLAAASSLERDGQEWIVESVDVSDTDALARQARESVGGIADVVVLVTAERPATVVVTSTGEQDASAVIEELTSHFGGGGGGSQEFAQGGGLDVAPDRIVNHFEA